jgi:hypothetical protein
MAVSPGYFREKLEKNQKKRKPPSIPTRRLEIRGTKDLRGGRDEE